MSHHPMTPNLLVMVGAGASFGARPPPRARPPLGAGLLDYVKRYLHQCQESAQPHRCPLWRAPEYAVRQGYGDDQLKDALALLEEAKPEETFEDIVNRQRSSAGEWSALDKRLRALTYAVVGALYYDELCFRLDDAFKPGRDEYDSLIETLRNRGFEKHNTTFVSLNYDLLLEGALGRSAPPGIPDYHNNLTVVYDWRVYKPHGSVNWMASPNHLGQLWNVSRDGLESDSIVRSVRPHEMVGNPCRPVLAHYSRFKPADVNREALKWVRDGTINAGKACSHAMIVGVRIPVDPKDDETLIATLDHLRDKSVLYIAGRSGQEDARRAREHDFCPVAKDFDEALADGTVKSFLPDLAGSTAS